jgi:hypothetical protein
MIGFGIAGGVLAGSLVGGLIGTNGGDTEAPSLESVPTASLPEVQGTLDPTQALQLVENARHCREPLARVAIWHSPEARGGTVSIRSRGYQSPQFVLTETPRLVALPYPAAYPSGHGVLTVVGQASGFTIALTPRRAIPDLKESVAIQVRWTAAEGCPCRNE